MNILVVGNGFDIAHGLPTKYTDFLNVIKITRGMSTDESKTKSSANSIQISSTNKLCENYEDKLIAISESNISYRLFFEYCLNKANKNLFISFYQYIKTNPLIDYYLSYIEAQPKNNKWVDFESELSKIIQYTEHISVGNHSLNNNKLILDLLRKFKILTRLKIGTNGMIACNINKNISTFPRLLLSCLNRIIYAFEIYLYICEEAYKVDNHSPDLEEIEFDNLISFNYTNTYIKNYEQSLNQINDTDFIHGNVSVNHIENEGNTNIVMGAPEHLTENDKNEKLTYVELKKYFQRIIKGTGKKYPSWLKSSDEPNDVYIFGHSIDPSDGDILRELITSEGTTTTIYNHDENSHKQHVINLIRILGQDEVITRTEATNPTLIFKRQCYFQ